MAAAGFFENGHGFLDVWQGVGGVLFLEPDFAHQMERDARLNAAAVSAAEHKAFFALRHRLREFPLTVKRQTNKY